MLLNIQNRRFTYGICPSPCATLVPLDNTPRAMSVVPRATFDMPNPFPTFSDHSRHTLRPGHRPQRTPQRPAHPTNNPYHRESPPSHRCATQTLLHAQLANRGLHNHRTQTDAELTAPSTHTDHRALYAVLMDGPHPAKEETNP
jgi:hypothetical protein